MAAPVEVVGSRGEGIGDPCVRPREAQGRSSPPKRLTRRLVPTHGAAGSEVDVPKPKAGQTPTKRGRLLKGNIRRVPGVHLEIKDASLAPVTVYRVNKSLKPGQRAKILADIKVDAYKGILEGDGGAVVEQLVREEVIEL